MKQIIILLLLTILISCKNSESKTSNQETAKKGISITFEKTFEGKISDKLEIVMKIKSNNGNVSGEYYYRKVLQNINLKGEITKNGEFKINEFDEKGNQTGKFKGNIDMKFNINGTWSKPNGEKEMTLSLRETNISYSLGLAKTFENNKGDISGTYKSTFNNNEYDGEIEIEIKNNQKFKFDITVATKDGCVGQIEGIGNLDTNGIGTFSDEDCGKLTFDFKNNKLKITENDCSEMHGMNCYFDGEYVK